MDFTSGDHLNTDKRSGDYGLWIFALVILALFFVWGRDKHHGGGYGMEGVMPVLAAGAMKGYNGGGHCVEEKIWDVERDQMREFANVREEIRTVGHQNAMSDARYFYDNRTATDKGFFDNAMLTQQVRHEADLGFARVEKDNLIQTNVITSRIDRLESEMKNKEIQQLTNKLNVFEILYGIRGHGAVPSYPVAGMAPLASGFVHSAPMCHS